MKNHSAVLSILFCICASVVSSGTLNIEGKLSHVMRKEADDDFPIVPPPPKKPSPPLENFPTGSPTQEPSSSRDDEWEGGDNGEDATKKKDGRWHILQTNSENQTTLFGMSRTASVSLMSVFIAVILFSLGGGVYKYASNVRVFTRLATSEKDNSKSGDPNQGSILPIAVDPLHEEEASMEEHMISKKRSLLSREA